MSTHTQPAVRAYLARVRTALSDLPAGEVDEIVDDGVVVETDPTIVTQRVSRAPAQDVVNLGRIDPFSEQGVNNLAQLGKAKLTDWLRQGL